MKIANFNNLGESIDNKFGILLLINSSLSHSKSDITSAIAHNLENVLLLL